jgi:hypothetical protein
MRHTRLASSGNPRPAIRHWLFAAACLLFQTGCTSALTTAYLRDALWDGLEHAAEAGPTAPGADASPEDAATTPDSLENDIAADRADAERRQAAIDEAIERLSRIGTLDAAAQAALVGTLQSTQQEDWPVVIEAFAATLADAQTPTVPTADAAATDVAAADAAGATAAPVSAPEPPATPAAEPQSPPVPADPVAPPAVAVIDPPAPQVAAPEPPAVAVPPLAVRNACFASRVQAWGVVDRVPDDRLAAGQEVIVYFELDGLTAGESPAGFTTCIDTSLRLVSEDGREWHAWKFEPVTETCVARRRDYFARFVVRLPAAAAGRGRLEIAVTDTLAGTTASAEVPFLVE